MAMAPHVHLPEHPTRTAVLAELGQTMEGDVARAITLTTACADAGAWGIKVQLLRPDLIAAEAAAVYWDDEHGYGDQRTAFTAAGLVAYDAWLPLREHCAGLRLAFVATPFDAEAVAACQALQVDAIKVASGDLTNVPLLTACREAALALQVPLLVSTGAATAAEVEAALAHLAVMPPELLVGLACSLQYPTPSSAANLARIGTLAAMGWPTVGYSDHTPHPWTALAAAAAGARLLEKHVSDGVAHGVPDNSFALTPGLDPAGPAGLAEYVANADEGARLRGDPELAPHAGELPARTGARRSLYWAASLEAGEQVAAGHVVPLRPHVPAAVDPADVGLVVEQQLTRPVTAGAPVLPTDLA